MALSAHQFKKMIDSDPVLLTQLKELYLHDADPCVHLLAQQILTRAGSDLPGARNFDSFRRTKRWLVH